MDRNLVLAILLSVVIILGFQLVFKMYSPPPAKQPVRKEAPAATQPHRATEPQKVVPHPAVPTPPPATVPAPAKSEEIKASK